MGTDAGGGGGAMEFPEKEVLTVPAQHFLTTKLANHPMTEWTRGSEGFLLAPTFLQHMTLIL